CICLIGDYDALEVKKQLKNIIGDITNIILVKDLDFDEIWHTMNIFLFDYAHLFGAKDSNKKNEVFNNLNMENKISHVNEIEKGDYIVHIKHGIGHYDGLQTITAQGIERDYLVLSYQNEEKVYLPTEKIDTLYKYVAGKD